MGTPRGQHRGEIVPVDCAVPGDISRRRVTEVPPSEDDVDICAVDSSIKIDIPRLDLARIRMGIAIDVMLRSVRDVDLISDTVTIAVINHRGGGGD
ncbi:MAG: hypothetical protein EXS00_07835 [Phycisphaerales bacterium]|nr:hypothetical protein [Phycisphaerales bacterium]